MIGFALLVGFFVAVIVAAFVLEEMDEWED